MNKIFVSLRVLPINQVDEWLRTGRGDVNYQTPIAMDVPERARPLDVVRLCVDGSIGWLRVHMSHRRLKKRNPYRRGIPAGAHIIATVGLIPEGMLAISPTTVDREPETILTSRKGLKGLLLVARTSSLSSVLEMLPFARAVPYGMAYPLDLAAAARTINHYCRRRCWFRVEPRPEPLVESLDGLQLAVPTVATA